MAIRKGNTLWWKTGMDNTGLQKGAVQAKGILRTMSQQITGMDVFAGLGAAAVLAFSKISKSAFDMSKKLDLAMREVQTISGAAQENFEGMVGSVRKLAKEVPEDAEGLAKALYQIVSAGYDGAAGLELLEVATKGAVAGVTDTLTAADGLTSVMNAWKISAEEATTVSDIFFTTVRLGKTTFGEMANSIALVAPLAASMGVQFKEVSGAVATLTKQGTPTSVAMTQIRQILISLNEHLGQSWRETYTFQEAVEKLSQIAADSGKNIKEFTGRIEGAVGILGLTGDNARVARKDLEEFDAALGATADAYEVMMKAAENQVKVMKSRWHDKLIEYGDSLTQMFGSLAANLNDKAVIQALRDEQLQINDTVLSILELSEGTDERKKALDDLKKAYPDIFENLDTENAKNEDLLETLGGVNEAYMTKISLASQDAKEKKLDRKLDRTNEKLDKQRLKLLEVALALGVTGNSYDDIEKKMRDLSMRDITELGGDVVTRETLQGAIDAIDALTDHYDKLKEKQSEVEEQTQAMLQALQTTPTEIGEIFVTPEGVFDSQAQIDAYKAAKEEEAKIREQEFDAFMDDLDKRREAYEEWTQIKKTQYAKDLRNHYNALIDTGKTYEEYLKKAVNDANLTADQRAEIIKELARLEIEYMDKVYEEQKEFYKKQLSEAEDYLDKQKKLLTKTFDKYLQQGTDSMLAEIATEKFDEVEKAYKVFGNIVYMTDEEFQVFIKGLDGAINILGEAGAAMQHFADQSDYVAQSIGKMTEGLAYLASQNYIGAILSFADAIVGFFEGMETAKKEASAQKEADHVDRLNRGIELLNRELEEHRYLMSQLEGKSWISAANDDVNLLRSNMTELEANMKDLQLRWTAPKDPWGKPDKNVWGDWIPALIGIDQMSVEEIQQFLDEHWDQLLEGPRNQMQAWIDDWDNAKKEIEQTLRDIQAETVGFDASFITDEIVSAFVDAEDGVYDFAETFEDVMRKAMINVWKQNFVQEQVKEFYDQLYQAITPGNVGNRTLRSGALPTFGGLSERELSDLQTSWDELVSNAEEGWDALQSFFDEALTDFEYPTKEGLEGAIKGVTEDTAQILAGQITAIRFNILENQEIIQDSLDTLLQIQINTTGSNLYLPSIKNELTRINHKLGGRF